MNLNDRINAFSELGKVLKMIVTEDESEQLLNNQKAIDLKNLVDESVLYNGWFTNDSVSYMLNSIADSLDKNKLEKWIKAYPAMTNNSVKQKTIAIVMAGNIPAVGFHDLLCVLLSGNRLLAKLSSDDNKLLPAICDILIEIEPRFEESIAFTEEKLTTFDAVIATGSNNTSRYFEYYFGKYKHIIRKNRNGIAILDGNESTDDLEGLCEDILMYYGLGCRNVSKLMVPSGYDFTRLIKALEKRHEINTNHKYFNNYEYNKAIYLVNGTNHLDSGNLLVVENEQIGSPISVLYYQYYENDFEVENFLFENREGIQCVLCNTEKIENCILLGTSQQPELWNYADNVDTLSFLLSID